MVPYGHKATLDIHTVCIQYDNIQLMHSFSVKIRICQPKNGEAEMNITFEG